MELINRRLSYPLYRLLKKVRKQAVTACDEITPRDLQREAEQLAEADGLVPIEKSRALSLALRRWVRASAGLNPDSNGRETLADLLVEIRFLRARQEELRPVFSALAGRRVLFAGQAYYNAWYLSRALRDLGWQADVLNWDADPTSQIYYHGEDILFSVGRPYDLKRDLRFYVAALYTYDVFHFSNAHGISFGFPLQKLLEREFGRHSEIFLLKSLGKKIVYGNNGCMDGVSQTSFSKWGPESVCAICRWRDEASVCSDKRNMEWGAFRNSVADFQCLLGGNRADFNISPKVHEVPEFYCLDREVWNPDMEIPPQFRLPPVPDGTIRLYHSVGNKALRTRNDGKNIKSTHVYTPLIKKLKAEGLHLELLEPTGIPNRDLRFMQMQADIFLDMLTFGWFGANAREAMMLAKPVICFIRPEWLESLRKEIPDYADTLPIVSATPDTVEEVLRDLIAHPQKRRDIGKRSREFAVRWHSKETAGRRFDEIYTRLLTGNSLLLEQYA